MTADSLSVQLISAASFLPWLKQQRGRGPIENDVYEAVSYWLNLGDRAVAGDARVDYRERAHEENSLWAKLRKAIVEKPIDQQDQYLTVLDLSKEVLDRLESIQPNKDGYLGTLKVLRDTFGFLQTDYAFRVTKTSPMGMRYSSGAVYVELQHSEDPTLSCSFGPESEDEISFWLDDLLFLSGDQRYHSLQNHDSPQTEEQVRTWFSYLASIWRQYGGSVLTNRPGIFDRLKEAQARRDLEHAMAMEKQCRQRD
jgi:hypothetical protein